MKKIVLLACFAAVAVAGCSKEEAAPAPAPAPVVAAPPPPPAPPPPTGADIQPEQADAVVAALEKELDAELAAEPE